MADKCCGLGEMEFERTGLIIPRGMFSSQDTIYDYVTPHQSGFVVYEGVHPLKRLEGVIFGLQPMSVGVVIPQFRHFLTQCECFHLEDIVFL